MGGPNDDATNTLHRAKGLEFVHVFRPLAYVAISRGMKRVTISHSALRIGPARPSDFMKNIPDEHVSRVGSDSLSAFRARRVRRHRTATAPLAPHDQQRIDDDRKHCFAGRV